ncbi:hypothetical protein [Bifidobacterium sp.]|jgi:hypothetical protein|uniref:hypothetical protein n=1 Tax=Bifidobacterium sp. TaxID=41200 RepID=UPI0025C211FB|nr:hypothetical protein [Bifidobacterium sp.]MCH4209128.1 hypothetical protein [Bifidobacterium sp.]
MSILHFRIIMWSLLGVLFLVGAVKELFDVLHDKNPVASYSDDPTAVSKVSSRRSGVNDLQLIGYACLAWTLILFIRHWTSEMSLDYALPAASGFVVARLSSLLPQHWREGWMPVVLAVVLGIAAALLIS